MKYFPSLLSAALLVTAVPSGFARNVFVIPATGSGQIQVYNNLLAPQAVITAPSTAFQVLSDPVGQRFIVVSATASTALSFYTSPLGTGTPNIVPLEQAPSQARMTPDGERILVIGNNNLYVVNTTTRSLEQTHQIGASPHFIAVNPDSRLVYVLSGGSQALFSVNIPDRVRNQVPVAGSAGGLAIGPNGLLYASVTNQIIEYAPANLALRGTIAVTGNPGRIAFNADGRTALVPNLQSLSLTGNSVYALNLQTRTVTQSVTIGSSSTPVVPETIYSAGGGRYIGLASKTQRIYEISIPAGTSFEPTYQPANPIRYIQASDEIPPRSLYLATDAAVSRVDVLASTAPASASITGGPISFAGAASLGPATAMFKLNDNQSISGSAQFTPIGVHILDAENRPVFNAIPNFTTGASGVTVTKLNSISGTDGFVYASVTAPVNTGAFNVAATLPTGLTQSFSLTSGTSGGGGGGGGNQGIVKVSGDGQIYLLNSPTKPLVIQVNDSAGSPLQNQAVTWSTNVDVATLNVIPRSAVTDANGQVTADLFSTNPSISFGAAFVQPTVTATSPSGLTVNFTVTILPAGSFSPLITILPDSTARVITGRVGDTLVGAIKYTVLTGGGVPQAGAPPPQLGVPIANVALSATTNLTPATGPTGSCKGGTVYTDGTGNGSCDLVLGGKLGRVPLDVLIGGSVLNLLPPFELQTTPGAPTAPTIVQGEGQTINANEITPRALVAQITDSAANPIAGVAGTWEIVTAGSLTLAPFTGTATDTSGRISTNVRAGTAPGTFQVRLVTTGGSVTFNVTVNASLGGIVPVSGQSNPVVVTGNPFPQALVVQVNDTQGRPVPGITIAWGATNGTVSAASTVTNASGQGSVNATAGPAAGAVTVTATVSGLSPAVFNLQARAPGPVLAASSFTNYATGAVGVVRGGLVMIRAQGLAPTVNGAVNANLLLARLPITLAGVTVQFGGVFAPIYQVANVGGTESVLIQAPFELPGSTTSATITVNGSPVSVDGVPVSAYGPGVLEDVDAGGQRFAIAIRSDGQRVTSSTPARRGERIRIYVIGLGQTNPGTQTNTVGSPGQAVALPVTVGLNNAGVAVVSAELAENLIGIYEVTFDVPADAATGAAIPLGFFIEVTPGVPTFANGSSIAIAAP